MTCVHLQRLYKLCQEHDLKLGGSDLIRMVCRQCGEQEVCPSTLMDEYDVRQSQPVHPSRKSHNESAANVDPQGTSMTEAILSRRDFLQEGFAAMALGCTIGACGRKVVADTPANVPARGGFRQAVAGWRREAGEAARDVLLNGGNAIDAAAAALLVLCVVDPTKVGIGGYGGSLALYHAKSGHIRAIDSDSRAPLKFDPSTFKEFGANYGYLAVGVPGVVAGIDLALREYGTLSFKSASKYALALAENGIPVTPSLSGAFQGLLKQIDPVSRRAYFPNGVPTTGSTWVQADLARLIRRLGDEGPASFYTGEIAARIARQVQANGGVLSEEDFHRFHAHNVKPLHINYRGYDLYTPQLPSGGLTSLSILKTLEQFDLIAAFAVGHPMYRAVRRRVECSVGANDSNTSAIQIL